MKRALYIFIASVAFFSISSCAKEGFLVGGFERENQEKVKFVAGFADTKTSYQGNGKVDWEKGDEIKYYSKKNGVVQTCQINESGHSATITTNLEKDSNFIVAIYGKSVDVDTSTTYDKSSLSLSGVVPLIQSGKFEDAHVALATSNDIKDGAKLSFHNLTSLIRFSLDRDDVDYVIFTSNGGEKLNDNGKIFVKLDDNGAPIAYLNSERCEKDNMLIVWPEGAGTFYFSIPPVTLSAGFNIEWYDSQNNRIGYLSSEKIVEISPNTILDLGQLGSPERKEEFPDSYIPFDWESGEVVINSLDENSCTLEFSGLVPDIVPGMVFNLDAEHGYDLRIVTDSNVNGNTISLSTEPAILADIFSNTTIVMTTSPEIAMEYQSTKSSGNNTIVCTPTAYIEQDTNGNYHYTSINSTKASAGVGLELWSWDYSLDGHVLWEKEPCCLSLEKFNFGMETNINLALSFGDKDMDRAIGKGIKQYFARTLSVKSWLSGKSHCEQILKFRITGSMEAETPKENTLIKENIVRKNFVFNVSGVPVLVTVGVDIYGKVKISSNGEIILRTGFTDHAEEQIGYEWTPDTGIRPFHKQIDEYNLILPTIEGNGHGEAKATIYPHIKFLIYSFLGPTIDILPYASFSADAAFKSTLGDQTHNFCAWGIKANAGFDGKMGLSFASFGREIENISTPEFNICNKELYRSPSSVKWNYSKIYPGEKNVVTFDVYDNNGILNQEVLTHLPQTVIFKGDGKISDQVCVVENGKATVNWEPSTDSDILYATLYDTYHNQIAQAKAVCYIEDIGVPDLSGNWVLEFEGRNIPVQLRLPSKDGNFTHYYCGRDFFFSVLPDGSAFILLNSSTFISYSFEGTLKAPFNNMSGDSYYYHAAGTYPKKNHWEFRKIN